jgi:hypothetical protein
MIYYDTVTHQYILKHLSKKHSNKPIQYLDISHHGEFSKRRQIASNIKNLINIELRYGEAIKLLVIKIDSNLYLFLAAFSHMVVDAATKNLFWYDLLHQYKQTEKSKPNAPSYRDYIACEYTIHSEIFKITNNSIKQSNQKKFMRFHESKFDDVSKKIIKRRIYFHLNQEHTAYIKSIANTKKLTLDNFLVGIIIKSISHYSDNDCVIAQSNIGNFLSPIFDQMYGPRLQDYIFYIDAIDKKTFSEIAIEAQNQRWESHFQYFPFSYGVGLVANRNINLDKLHYKILFSFFLLFRKLLSPFLTTTPEMLDIYFGLVKYAINNFYNEIKILY